MGYRDPFHIAHRQDGSKIHSFRDITVITPSYHYDITFGWATQAPFTLLISMIALKCTISEMSL
jgi:hypothetical protein